MQLSQGSAASAATTPDYPSQLKLLVELRPRHEVFFENLRDLLLPRRMPPLELTSAPGDFWADVFVRRPLSVRNIVRSYTGHVLFAGLVYAISLGYFLQTHTPPLLRNPFENTTLEYYQVSEYLPPVSSAPRPAKKAQKGEPAFARQEIISVPPDPDNIRQTIVTPDARLITKDIPLPNIVSNTPAPVRPMVDLPDSSKLRMPSFQQQVVAPAPDIANMRSRTFAAQTDVVAPAPDVANARSRSLRTTQTDVVAPAADPIDTLHKQITFTASVVEPPPAVDTKLPAGAMNVAKLSSVAEPKLAVAEQRATGAAGAATRGGAVAGAQNVPVPPSPQGIRGRGTGQLIALSVQPADVKGPIEIPQGSRHGTFAASPEGKPGAPGTPTLAIGGGTNGSGGSGMGSGAGHGSADEPAGIYVAPGATKATVGPVVAKPAPAPERNNDTRQKLMAAMHSPALPAPSRTSPPTVEPRTGDKIEEQVFGEKRYYSMILNMPNLTSASGSWIVRFAELKASQDKSELSAPVALNKVDPAYPADLVRDKVEGTVVLYAVIRADGSIDAIRVLSSVEERLDAAAMKALSRWRFRPGTKHGEPVDLEAVVQIPFRVARLRF